jgi:hypothetical protein
MCNKRTKTKKNLGKTRKIEDRPRLLQSSWTRRKRDQEEKKFHCRLSVVAGLMGLINREIKSRKLLIDENVFGKHVVSALLIVLAPGWKEKL